MKVSNIYYNELVANIRSESLKDVMGWMAYHSQSLILNYGEDNQQWECAWINDLGRRFWAVRADPLDGLKDILNQARTAILEGSYD